MANIFPKTAGGVDRKGWPRYNNAVSFMTSPQQLL